MQKHTDCRNTKNNVLHILYIDSIVLTLIILIRNWPESNLSNWVKPSTRVIAHKNIIIDERIHSLVLSRHCASSPESVDPNTCKWGQTKAGPSNSADNLQAGLQILMCCHSEVQRDASVSTVNMTFLNFQKFVLFLTSYKRLRKNLHPTI